jgi:glycosyltransferase involved in cell wall biosynthesis
MISVSVIIPVYRQRKDWFLQALDSVLAQDYPKEIIVSGITGDESLEVAKSVEGINTVESTIPDPKRQINAGIAAASGDAVLYGCSDDFLLRGALKNMADVYEEKRAVLVYGDLEYCDPELNMVYTKRFPHQIKMDKMLERQQMADVSLVSRAVLEEFGLYDITLSKFAIWDMWLKILEKYPDRIHHCGHVLWKYRRHAMSLARVGLGEEYRDRFYEKWGITYRYHKIQPSFNGILING